MHGKIWY
jgi:hypothetical protein